MVKWYLTLFFHKLVPFNWSRIVVTVLHLFTFFQVQCPSESRREAALSGPNVHLVLGLTTQMFQIPDTNQNHLPDGGETLLRWEDDHEWKLFEWPRWLWNAALLANTIYHWRRGKFFSLPQRLSSAWCHKHPTKPFWLHYQKPLTYRYQAT